MRIQHNRQAEPSELPADFDIVRFDFPGVTGMTCANAVEISAGVSGAGANAVETADEEREVGSNGVETVNDGSEGHSTA